MEKGPVVWIEDQTSHNIPLSQSLIHRKAVTLQFCEGWGSKEAAKEKFETSRGWFMTFKEINQFHDIKVQGEATSADGKVVASYPSEDHW